MKALGVQASDDELEEQENKSDKYERKEYAAQHILLMTVSPCLATIVKRMSVADTWTAIHNDTTSKSQLHKVDTCRRLQMMHCDEDRDVKAHC